MPLIIGPAQCTTVLATTPFGVGGRAAKTPGSPQTGNLGLFSTTPLALLRGRPMPPRARLMPKAAKCAYIGQVSEHALDLSFVIAEVFATRLAY